MEYSFGELITDKSIMHQNVVLKTFIDDDLIISTTDFHMFKQIYSYYHRFLLVRIFKGFMNINATTSPGVSRYQRYIRNTYAKRVHYL